MTQGVDEMRDPLRRAVSVNGVDALIVAAADVAVDSQRLLDDVTGYVLSSYEIEVETAFSADRRRELVIGVRTMNAFYARAFSASERQTLRLTIQVARAPG